MSLPVLVEDHVPVPPVELQDVQLAAGEVRRGVGGGVVDGEVAETRPVDRHEVLVGHDEGRLDREGRVVVVGAVGGQVDGHVGPGGHIGVRRALDVLVDVEAGTGGPNPDVEVTTVLAGAVVVVDDGGEVPVVVGGHGGYDDIGGWVRLTVSDLDRCLAHRMGATGRVGPAHGAVDAHLGAGRRGDHRPGTRGTEDRPTQCASLVSRDRPVRCQGVDDLQPKILLTPFADHDVTAHGVGPHRVR